MSSPISDEQRARKRQKCSHDIGVHHPLPTTLGASVGVPNSASTMSVAGSPAKSSLKGRRRYNADVEDMIRVSERGFECGTLSIADFRRGDEDDTFTCRVVETHKDELVVLNFFISDTSDYPVRHAFFCHSSDEHTSPAISQVIESLSEEPSRTIEDMLQNLLTVLDRKLKNDEDTDEDMEDGFIDYDEHSDDGLGAQTTGKDRIDYHLLQNHFNEVVAYEYRPGFIPFGADDYVLSVSIPIIKLVGDIPARALMAWDRRLLARTQHLTLLVTGLRDSYPVLQTDGTVRPDAATRGMSPQFRIGLTPIYKPQKEHVAAAVRVFGLKEAEQAEAPKDSPIDLTLEDEEWADAMPVEEEPQVEETSFQPFSLSASLETLMNQRFLRVVQLRLAHDLGWAGAELLAWEAEKQQQKPTDVLKNMRQQIRQADEKEVALSSSYSLPPDPLLGHERDTPINLPLVAFCYLLRRLTLSPRYCSVCHEELQTEYDSLKPYVCDKALCTYQYYNLNFGSSLDYEICENTEVVDLLVSVTYVAAKDGTSEGPFPIGLGLWVPPVPYSTMPVDDEGLCDFDQLDKTQMCKAIVALLNELPSITSMKRHLDKPIVAGRAKPKLRDLAPSVPPAAWKLLRWCVGSCLAHLEELHLPEDRVANIDPNWRQFRFSVGAPDAEAKYKAALQEVQKVNANAVHYPSLYAFHGSPMKNWHSIIRHGLWYKTVANGRAYGNGVYFAKNAEVSLGYSVVTGSGWSNSSLNIQSCVALAEIVNMPSAFVSTTPYLVVPETEWIICRYLLVRAHAETDPPTEQKDIAEPDIPYVRLDPQYTLTMANKPVKVPEPSYRINQLLSQRSNEYLEVDYDADDMTVFKNGEASTSGLSRAPTQGTLDEDDWVHDPVWVSASIQQMLPPPLDASPQATMALQRELKAMLKEQDQAKNLRELGWYMPQEFIGDNLYQWVIELHSFDKNIPLAKDMVAKGINSLVFEIRFPEMYPHAPPFFRILKPRLLPFIQVGGSMCMDLLTTDGWLPSYSIAAILLQIKLAISNLEPRPARLAQNWDMAYGMQEALDGYKRAANTHGWAIPRGIEKLTH
ncbi:hypothetical protein FOMPIDRAFT_1032740 [Fomitopsis schrenkii]|uniref:UBC core domain-containing protein n=1 Tax=Fomitopsis schrenkii TaxID=2126942 RepID=S8DT33_FOMSC|nr:hypothetical protein FOMPIDRAFT_1032740 [Fomitopsis schrenkii]